MMKALRRTQGGLLGLCLQCLLVVAAPQAGAQRPAIPVVAMLCPESCAVGWTESEPVGSMFLRGLRARGHVDGKTLILDTRGAGVAYGRLPHYAEQLVRQKSAAILAEGWAATEAARRATTTIPVIMVGVPDAERGLLQSLARPGGNVTGLTYPYESLATKQLELLRETVPRAVRIGILINPANPEHEKVLPAVEAAARAAAVELVKVEVRQRADFARAIDSLKGAGVGAALVLGDQLLYSGELLLHALNHRLPTISLKPSFVEAGGLMSYGPSPLEMAERVAFYVDRVLGGAPPGSLPAEQPTRFELVINVTTAKALGIALPQSVLLRANRLVR